MRSKQKLLFVDDEPDMLTVYQLLLSRCGFEVVTAANAIAALRLIEESLPDLVITDLAMPWMGGLELCRALRKRTDTRSIPIILYTGADPIEEPPGLYSVRVTKPVELEVLINLIRALLTARRA